MHKDNNYVISVIMYVSSDHSRVVQNLMTRVEYDSPVWNKCLGRICLQKNELSCPTGKLLVCILLRRGA